MGKKASAGRRACAALLALLLAGCAAAAASAAAEPAAAGRPQQKNGALRIVALGDSISAGYEPGVRSAADVYGYVDRLYEQALLRGRAELANYAVVGLTSEGLRRLLQSVAAGETTTAAQLQDFSKYNDPRVLAQAEAVAAQTAGMRKSLADADIVVITIGGNDFTDYIRNLSGMSADEAIRHLNEDFDPLVNNYADQVGQALTALHAAAPNARVYLANQYSPIAKGVGQKLYDALNAAVDKVGAKLEETVQALSGGESYIRIVPLADLFKGREAMYTHFSLLGDEKDFHPNQYGYEAIAKAFSEAIWSSYRPLAAQAKSGEGGAPQPPAIYVRGERLNSPNRPALRGGATFLALTDVAAAVSAELSWEGRTKTAAFRYGGREVAIAIGSREIRVDGQVRPLGTVPPAYLQKVGQSDKTYVPLAAIAEGLGFDVVYRPRLHTAFINP